MELENDNSYTRDPQVMQEMTSPPKQTKRVGTLIRQAKWKFECPQIHGGIKSSTAVCILQEPRTQFCQILCYTRYTVS